MINRHFKRAIEYRNLKKFEHKYTYEYQNALTKSLDSITRDELFDRYRMFQIHLWKLNRYARFGDEVIEELNKLRMLTRGQHKEAKKALELLLETKGVDLPLASTFLRFRNSDVFQIIDQRAYRVIYGEKYPFRNGIKSQSLTTTKITKYFDYLDKLLALCKQRGLEFKTIDRLLYVLDKKINCEL